MIIDFFFLSCSESKEYEMKLLITGSRSYDNYEGLKTAIESLASQPTEILHGGARGADQLAEQYAKAQGIPTTIIKPDYQKHNYKAAPLERNSELVQLADATLALYGKGRDRKGGTWDAAKKTIAANKPLTERLSNGTLRTTTPTLQLF